MKVYQRTFSFFCIGFVLLIYCEALLAQPIPSDALSQLVVACSPDKPIVRPGEAVRLRAYSISPEGKPLQYGWAASGGRVGAQGSEVKWD